MNSRRPRAWYTVWILVGVLAILHYDFWLWSDARLLSGFLPVGLAYHIVYSLAAGLTWALVLRFAWPKELEDWAANGPGIDDASEANQPS